MRIQGAIALAAVIAIAGCGGPAAVSGSGNASQAPNAQAANAYLATGSGWVNYLQWDSTGTGTFTADTITGTAPDEQVSSQQTPITASVNGSEVTFGGLQQDTGTLANGTLTLQVLDQQTGMLGTDQFSPATQDQFNQAALKLSQQAGSDNSAAVQQQQQASQASANAASEQQAQTDLATVQGISFTSDLSGLNGDVTTANNGLGTVKSDATHGQGQDCGNADTVEGDFDTVTGDSDSLSGGLDGFTNDVSGARSAIGTLQSDLSGLKSAGQPAPAGASTAITSAQGAISSAINAANGDIGDVNGDVSAASQVLGSLATGPCGNIGVPYSPKPIPLIK